MDRDLKVSSASESDKANGGGVGGTPAQPQGRPMPGMPGGAPPGGMMMQGMVTATRILHP